MHWLVNIFGIGAFAFGTLIISTFLSLDEPIGDETTVQVLLLIAGSLLLGLACF